MKILVVGNGAREDALSWRLAQSASCESIFHAPGNAGTASRGENWDDLKAIDGKGIAQRARERGIDLVVVGPETSIAAGVTDHLRDAGIAVFGPSRSAGRLESSKVFAKRFMERHQIPTARARVIHSLDQAQRALAEWNGGCVLKADGLAAGKGVVVTSNVAEAHDVVNEWFGARGIPGGGTSLLLEERLEGREVSVFAIGDGSRFVPFAAACDYKRAGDGDIGPNTGGMGAYSPPAALPPGFEDLVRKRILEPVERGLTMDGEHYVGVLYCGLMLTAKGPQVIEFNVRFGDPETQVVMPRIEGDFAQMLAGAAAGSLEPDIVRAGSRACVGVVIASRDYPLASTPLRGLPVNITLPNGCNAFWAASSRRGEVIDVGGGRIVTVTALGDGIPEARARAYEAARQLTAALGLGDAVRYRRDVAAGIE